MTANQLLNLPENTSVNRRDLLDWFDGVGEQIDATQANIDRLTGISNAKLDISDDATTEEILDAEFISD